MSERMWPVDAVAGAPRYSGRGLRQLHSPFLGPATAADPLGARSGVRPGTSPALVTATSTTWRCGLHAGVLDVQPAVEAGSYTYAIDEAVTGAINAADASNPRTDRVFVQLTDQAEGNASSTTPPSVVIRYVAGTPRADAPVPTLPARSMRLARINVPKQGGGTPTVTFEAPFASGAGGVVIVTDATDRDAIAYDGLVVYRQDTRALESRRNGVWYSSEHYAEFSTLSGGAPNGSKFGVGTLTLDAGASKDASFATIGNGSLQLPAGSYAWTLDLVPDSPGDAANGAITGRTWVQAEIPGGKEQRVLAVPNVGEDKFSGSGNFDLTASGTVTWSYFKTTTRSPSRVVGRLYLKRMA